MGQVIRIGQHHDRSEGWAREPKLTPVVTLRERRRERERRLIIEIAVISFGLGWAAHTLILG